MTKTTYSLCESMDITDGNSTISANLTWEYDATYLENVDGNDYSIKVKDNAPTTPTEVTFTATLTEYSVDGGTAVSVTNGKVGEYTATIAAPLKLRVDTNNSAALTSGVDGTGTIVVPTNGLVTINENATITVEETTSSGKALLGTPTMSSTGSDENGDITLAINAKPNQLPAVLASDTPTEGTDYETATVKFTIPASALTLTDAGKQAGWYIPNDDLTLTANVKVWHPLIKITKLDTSENNVTVTFDAEHWRTGNYSEFVWMALVPNTATTFPSGNTGYVKSNQGEGVTGNGINYSVDISTSNLTAGDYNVWVSIDDDGDWMKSNQTYTRPTATTSDDTDNAEDTTTE